ncbi:MAG: hypothetical protein JOZ12_00390, partial [Sinobacteraceae bacterium]|nr:hypothetical protein [Nevskiaceae bacterium]
THGQIQASDQGHGEGSSLATHREQFYTVLNAMAFLACAEGRCELAARIALHADVAHETHGQLRRRPAQERMRAAVSDSLDLRLGSLWRSGIVNSRERFDEAAACELALGLRA